MKKFEKKISVIFPAYNEEANIEPCVLDAYNVLKQLVSAFEIIVINDGSTDGTRDICRRLEKSLENIMVISKNRNEGYGYAVRDGFAAAKYDLVFFSDSDRQFNISDLKNLLEHADGYDIVVGFRKVRRDSFGRKIFSAVYNLLVGLVLRLKVKDVNCAFKLFDKKVFEKIKIESKWYVVNAEILAKANALGFSIKEVGVSHFPRLAGRSKTRLADIFKTMKELIRIRRLLPHNNK